MEDPTESDTASQRATAELNRVVEAVTAEISARNNETNDADTTKTNRRFATAKAARLSEVAGIARTATRQLAAAKTRVLNEVTKAEAAGFTVQEDLSVVDSSSEITNSTTEAGRHAAAIQAAVTDLVALDEQVAARLTAAAKDLQDFSDN